MEKWIIGNNEQSQRLDKYLRRRMPAAGSSFLYKMLRKKNITLNGTKADGREILHAGDEVSVFFAKETLDKFMGIAGTAKNEKMDSYLQAFDKITAVRMHGELPILYEDEHILLVIKPAGVLSQKAKPQDISMNEWLLGYLIKKKEIKSDSLSLFKPSVCNRLDYQTGGILLCAKTLPASQMFAALLKERSLHKYYHMVVKGQISKSGVIKGYLQKDAVANRVSFRTVENMESAEKESAEKFCSGKEDSAVYTETHYKPLRTEKEFTLLEALLVTGKTHQLRAHLASRGNPIAGDPKYGDAAVNALCRERFGVQGQLLFACRICFPAHMPVPFEYLQGREFTAPDPRVFARVMNGH